MIDYMYWPTTTNIIFVYANFNGILHIKLTVQTYYKHRTNITYVALIQKSAHNINKYTSFHTHKDKEKKR